MNNSTTMECPIAIHAHNKRPHQRRCRHSAHNANFLLLCGVCSFRTCSFCRVVLPSMMRLVRLVTNAKEGCGLGSCGLSALHGRTFDVHNGIGRIVDCAMIRKARPRLIRHHRVGMGLNELAGQCARAVGDDWRTIYMG